MNISILSDEDAAAAGPTRLVVRLARFLRARPGVWIDGRTLATVAGSYAWRSRVSDLRRAPFGMTLVNRQRRIRTAGSVRITISEYRYER